MVMDHIDYHPKNDAQTYFMWPEFNQARGPVTLETLWEFFSSSPFWDRSSTNDQLRMQTRHTGVAVENEEEELKRFAGIEFALVHHRPPHLFVIQKRQRTSPTETSRPLATYFVIHNRAYQAPDIYRVLSTRLLSSVSALQSSFDILSQHKPEYTPRTGFAWPIVAGDDSAKQRRDGQQPSDSQPGDEVPLQEDKEDKSRAKKVQTQNLRLLEHAMVSAKMHSKLPEFIEPTEPLAPTSAAPPAVATPAPVPTRAASQSAPTPAPSAPEAPIKGIPGAGKKKKKRTLAAAPPGPS